MSLTSLTYSPPVRRRTESVRPDFELLEAAIAAFDQGDHAGAIQQTLEHLFGRRPPDLMVDKLSFVQGSSRVTLKIEGGELCASVPLVKLTEGGKSTAALRYLLTRVSGSGQLHQPRLRGDEVYLEFRDKLARMHPHKLIELLRRMPVEADETDDWLVDQFGVLPLGREPIDPLDDGELSRAETIWKTHWAEVEELHKESQRKRSMFFLNEVTAYAIYHLRASLPIAGSLLARLTESSDVFNDSDVPPMRREATLAKCIKEMQGVPSEELKNHLGHAHYSISPLAIGTPSVLSHYLGEGDYVDTVQRMRSSGGAMVATVALVSTYNYLLARFSWPEEVEAGLVEALAQMSGQSWRSAASILTLQGKLLAERFMPDDEDDDEDDDGEDAGGDDDASGEDEARS